MKVMTKKKLLVSCLGILLLLGFAACAVSPQKSEPSEETITQSTAPPAVQDAIPSKTAAEAPPHTEPSETAISTEAEHQATQSHTESTESAEVNEPEVTAPQPAETTPVQTQTPASKPNKTVPTETTAPPVTEPQPTEPPATELEETDPPASEPSVTEPPETESVETESPTTEASVPEFDIDYWIGYAKSYASSVGLNLDSSAVDCWDNPIRAGSQCTYLERDIQSRLSRYAKGEDITDVWVWTESLGDGTYDLYIGYA